MKIVGASQTRTGRRERFAAIDMARGVALVAMIVYHFAWDLWFYGLTSVEIPFDPFWRNFARAIAASFLILVGIGLVFAHEAGLDRGAFLRRLAKVAGAAALVTAATFVAFPESFIYFGILHMIAAGSVLALPFLRLPPLATLLVALAVLVAPAVWSSPVFDTRLLAWIGFAQTPPDTNDFEPIFPWFAAVLTGVVLGRLLLSSRLRPRLAAIRAQGRLARGLVLMGRWSLVVYLLHQPVLLGLLYPVALVAGPGATPIVRECRVSCEEAGRSQAFCERYCECAIGTLQAEGLMSIVERGAATPEQQSRFDAVVDACSAQALDGLPAPD